MSNKNTDHGGEQYITVDLNTLSTVVEVAVSGALEKRSSYDNDLHKKHHEWLAEEIEERRNRVKRRKDLYFKIHATVIGGVVLAIIIWAGSVLINIGEAVMSFTQNNIPPSAP